MVDIAVVHQMMVFSAEVAAVVVAAVVYRTMASFAVDSAVEYQMMVFAAAAVAD